MILTQISIESHENRKEAQFGSTVMMVLLAFSKVLFYSDGHSLERLRDMKQKEWHSWR